MWSDNKRLAERFYDEFVNRGDDDAAEMFIADDCLFQRDVRWRDESALGGG